MESHGDRGGAVWHVGSQGCAVQSELAQMPCGVSQAQDHPRKVREGRVAGKCSWSWMPSPQPSCERTGYRGAGEVEPRARCLLPQAITWMPFSRIYYSDLRGHIVALSTPFIKTNLQEKCSEAKGPLREGVGRGLWRP